MKIILDTLCRQRPGDYNEIEAVISVFTALGFAGLSARLPEEGGTSEFVCKMISPFAGFIAVGLVGVTKPGNSVSP